MSATFPPISCPDKAAVVESISLIPGPPFGPSYLITITSPSLYPFSETHLKASSSQSKHLAIPSKKVFSIPATLTMAPSGARLPFKPTTPPVGLRGLLYGLITF